MRIEARIAHHHPWICRKLRRASSAAGHDRCDRGCCTMDWLKLFQVVSTSLKASQHQGVRSRNKFVLIGISWPGGPDGDKHHEAKV